MSDFQTIEEIYGIPTDGHGQTHQHGNVTIRHQSQEPTTQGKLIEGGDGFRPTEWQKKLSHHMMKNDAVFALAAPAAGKTSPLVRAFYLNLYLARKNNINMKSQSYPRVLYVSPRTQLANQVAINDFTLNSDNGIIRLLAREAGIDPRTIIPPNRQRTLLEEAYRDYVGVVAGNGGTISAVTSSKFVVKPFIAATYQHALKIMNTYGSYINTIIVDELQEYMPKPGKPTIIEDGKAKSLMSIMGSALSSKKGLILATGSVNVNSAKQFVKFLEDTYGRKFIFDDGIKDVNRSKLTLIPYTKMRNSSELVGLTKELISANKTNNVIITFAKKEKPVNQLSILTTAQMLQRVLPVVNKNFLSSGKRKDKTLGQFTRDEIGAVYDEPPAHEKELRGTEFRNVNDIEELMYYSTDAMMSSKDGEAVHVTKRNPDNLLIQSVLRGFGFILGGMEDRQKAIIQKLFMDNKLKVLFATDAIGVGANVLAHNLFLPDLHKFEDGTFGPINTSSLVQLINRAGRKGGTSIPYANVYVREKDMALAQQVLSKDPGIAADEIDIDFTKDTLTDKLTKLQKFEALFARISRGI